MGTQTKNKQVPLLDLKAQYQEIQDEIEHAVLEVLRSGYYVLGPNVKAFENEAADFLGAKHAIGCANGSDALYLALLALDIKAGDEVITTPFTFAATSEAIVQVGAKPVFADIDLDSFNIDPKEIEKKITDKSKAIILVHLYGQACDMDVIMAIAQKHNLKVIEDTAQAFGTNYQNKHAGTIGHVGTYSFYPTKNLSAAGDAGMLTTNSDEIAERLKRIRVHGSSKRYYHDELGVNSRLDEIQAAILRIKLKYIKGWNQRRAEIAEIYNQAFVNHPEIITPKTIENSTHIYHQYSIRSKNRDQLKEKLAAVGISSEVYYPVPMHMQKLHADLGHKVEDFPNALKASQEVLCLPIYPELEQEQIETVINSIKN